jgi:hypothetical protein
MDILEEIRNTIAKFDPELSKNEADDSDKDDSEFDMNIDSYQNAIDSAADPEDLNFAMDNLFDDEDGDEVEHFEIPQKDYDEETLEVGDTVQKISGKNTGTILTIGELVEVEWQEDLITLEYPEELLKVDDNREEEKDKVHSMDTDPPIPIEGSDELEDLNNN